MRDYRDAKIMVAALRQMLRDKQVNLPHGECLEVVAGQFGLKSWNVLASKIDAARAQHSPKLPWPIGWWSSGTRADLYEMGVDPEVRWRGRGVALIRSRHPDEPLAYAAGVFATLMQSVDAASYRGKRLAMDADLRSMDVAGAASIWFRVDRAPGQLIAFDNMETRAVGGPLVGSQDWTNRRIVLDVEGEAATLNYGFMLRGVGSVWAANVRLAEVGLDVPVTSTGSRKLDRPDNLDFSRMAGAR